MTDESMRCKRNNAALISLFVVNLLFNISLHEYVKQYKDELRRQEMEAVTDNVASLQNEATDEEKIGKDCVDCKSKSIFKCQRWQTGNDVLLQNAKVFYQKTDTGSERYLLPWLYNGPMNQWFGLRQAVRLAMALNRTLVLPRFMKHLSAEEIDANHRVDVKSLSSLLPVVNLETYHQSCGTEVGVLMLGTSPKKSWVVESLQNAESVLNITIYDHQGDKSDDQQFLMDTLPENPSANYHVCGDEETLRREFSSASRCAVYAFPFREFQQDTESCPRWSFHDIKTNRKIDHSLKHPEYIIELAKLFIDHHLVTSSSIAAHWRFDDDFFDFMCNGGNPERGEKRNENIEKMCSQTKSLNPLDLLPLLLNISDASSEKVQVYFASPREVAKELSLKMKNASRYKIEVFTSNDVIRFFEERGILSKCDFIQPNLNDVISYVEQIICIESKVFVRSIYSSWSDFVTLMRKLHYKTSKFDTSLKKLMMES